MKVRVIPDYLMEPLRMWESPGNPRYKGSAPGLAIQKIFFSVEYFVTPPLTPSQEKSLSVLHKFPTLTDEQIRETTWIIARHVNAFIDTHYRIILPAEKIQKDIQYTIAAINRHLAESDLYTLGIIGVLKSDDAAFFDMESASDATLRFDIQAISAQCHGDIDTRTMLQLGIWPQRDKFHQYLFESIQKDREDYDPMHYENHDALSIQFEDHYYAERSPVLTDDEMAEIVKIILAHIGSFSQKYYNQFIMIDAFQMEMERVIDEINHELWTHHLHTLDFDCAIDSTRLLANFTIVGISMGINEEPDKRKMIPTKYWKQSGEFREKLCVYEGIGVE